MRDHPRAVSYGPRVVAYGPLATLLVMCTTEAAQDSAAAPDSGAPRQHETPKVDASTTMMSQGSEDASAPKMADMMPDARAGDATPPNVPPREMCTQTQDCSTGVCLTLAGVCVECITHDDCNDGQVCDQRTCIDPGTCDSEAACTALDLHCDLERELCVECLETAHCGQDERCHEGDCVAKECTAASTPKCNDNSVATCSTEGLWELQSCGALTCVEDEGSATCVDYSVGTKPNQYGVAWQDAFMFTPCYSVVSNFSCLTRPDSNCPGQDAPNFEDRGDLFAQTFATGGEKGKLYSVHIVVNGIVEGKEYRNGSRDAVLGADLDPPEGIDTFYRGGEPIPSNYNSYKVTVLDPDGNEFAHYYLNSFPPGQGFEAHRTYPIGYEKDIDVPGGGSIIYRIQSTNCRAINNCGPGIIYPDSCPAPRDIPNEPGLQLPATYLGQSLASMNVVNGAQQPFHAQAVHIRVTDVVEKQQ